MVAENYRYVLKKVEEACARSGRDPKDVTLIAVSKTKPIEMIEEAMEAGARVFGENKVQELCDKYEQLPKDLHWHLIGHLQRNKVKYIVDKAELIHSVDSLKLAEEISKEALKKNVEEIAKLPGIHIQGLMTIAPYTTDPEENRPVFRTLKKLAVDIKKKNIDNVCMDVLSMGMTGDYQVAVEEGATLVRVGTGIFGERNYEVI